MSPSKRKPPKPPPPPKPKKLTNAEIVSKFLKELPKSGVAWGKEIASLNHLRKRFPDEDFWQKGGLPIKVESMIFFLSDYGLGLVDKAYRQFHYSPPPIPELPKLGEVIAPQTVAPQKKTLFQFLS